MTEKSRKEEETMPPTNDFPTSVDCPVHHQPLMVQTEQKATEDGKRTVMVRFAICNCKVPDNNVYGQRVWEQS